ncbi:cytochrome c oxidase assembly protein [Pseudalkalibacillus hwajinpoensis]|uniref:cytochrome c oxidase assembly protein n=1 Tax=Guptibacillus hwajinpoensis TaxID=208199 RepID=UPI00325AE937
MLYELILISPFMCILVLYFVAAIVSSRKERLKKWPLYRYGLWFLGVFSAVAALVGPVAKQAHVDFTAHMLGHLLLGMLAPLLLALAAPMTLVLRTLSVSSARRVSSILKSKFVRLISHPIFALFLNIGGLWFLYATDLYAAMQQSLILHWIVHLHVFLAGYLFTVSIIYIDPTPHQYPFIYRGIVFLLAFAGHGILSKYIYAHPPVGVTVADAEAGGMLMYYGGDIIDATLICILFYQWFRATRSHRFAN